MRELTLGGANSDMLVIDLWYDERAACGLSHNDGVCRLYTRMATAKACLVSCEDDPSSWFFRHQRLRPALVIAWPGTKTDGPRHSLFLRGDLS